MKTYLRYNIASPRVAPVVGDFNNAGSPLFLEYDPKIKNNFKGVIYIASAGTDTTQDLRNKNARNTAYDSRNDPAWHYTHGTPMFEVIRIVKLGITAGAVNSVDDLEATDNDNNPITQAWLDQQMRLLNGLDSFDGLSSRNTSRFTAARQRDITRMVDGVENEDTRRKRDKSIALAAFNKTEMLRIKIANKFGEGRIAVFNVEFGTGGISATARAEGAFFNSIPKPMFEPNILPFHAIQNHFDLVNQGKNGKTRYIDFLDEDVSLNFLVFKPRQGKQVIKRPSEHHKKWPSAAEYSEAERERYECFSEGVDINSNMADLIVVKKDWVMPIMDYLVVLQGSTNMISHLNHIGNLIPHWFKRNMFDEVKNFLI